MSTSMSAWLTLPVACGLLLVAFTAGWLLRFLKRRNRIAYIFLRTCVAGVSGWMMFVLAEHFGAKDYSAWAIAIIFYSVLRLAFDPALLYRRRWSLTREDGKLPGVSPLSGTKTRDAVILASVLVLGIGATIFACLWL